MKKLIVMTTIFALVLGAGIFESIYVNGYFTSLAEDLEGVYDVVCDLGDDEKSEVAKTAMEQIMREWEKSSVFFYLLNNNNVLNNLYDKIGQAREYIKQGKNADASVMLKSARQTAVQVARDIRPLPTNFL